MSTTHPPALAHPLWQRWTRRGVLMLCVGSLLLAGAAWYAFATGSHSSSSQAGRQTLTLAMLGLIICLTSLAALALRAHTGSTRSLWGVVIVFSVLSIGAMSYFWSLTLAADHQYDLGTPLFSQADVSGFLAANPNEQAGGSSEAQIAIPTGVFIQSIDFTSANNVIVTGYIWQKYGASVPADVDREIVLPEAESVDIEKAYERQEGDVTVVGWYVTATLREQFDYSRFPFDRQEVWLRLWPKDFDRNIILTPDFDAYKEITPTALPGIEKDFVLDGWLFDGAFFTYRGNSYNTNFGISKYVGESDFPELYYNIGLKRDFINAFIGQLIPLIVIALMIFAVLIISTKDERRVGLAGFNTAAVLGYCAALFFVVIVSHIQLRTSLSATTILYLENFYFVLYLAILLVSMNAILMVSDTPPRLIEARDNLAPKLLFWPLVLGLLLVVTLYTFY